MGPKHPRLPVRAEGWPDTSRLNPMPGLDATPVAHVQLRYCYGIATVLLRRSYEGYSMGFRRGFEGNMDILQSFPLQSRGGVTRT
jgi:hypothetical protein